MTFSDVCGGGCDLLSPTQSHKRLSVVPRSCVPIPVGCFDACDPARIAPYRQCMMCACASCVSASVCGTGEAMSWLCLRAHLALQSQQAGGSPAHSHHRSGPAPFSPSLHPHASDVALHCTHICAASNTRHTHPPGKRFPGRWRGFRDGGEVPGMVARFSGTVARFPGRWRDFPGWWRGSRDGGGSQLAYAEPPTGGACDNPLPTPRPCVTSSEQAVTHVITWCACVAAELTSPRWRSPVMVMTATAPGW